MFVTKIVELSPLLQSHFVGICFYQVRLIIISFAFFLWIKSKLELYIVSILHESRYFAHKSFNVPWRYYQLFKQFITF